MQVIFTRPRKGDFLCWSIRLLTWAPYCHVALRVQDRIFHAVTNGCLWADEQSFAQKNKIVACFDIKLNDSQQSSLLQACKKIVGTPYDWSGVVGLGLMRLAHLVGYEMRDNPLKNNSQFMFCSELAYRVLSSLKLIPVSRSPELLDPKRFLRWLEKAKNPLIKRLF